MNLSPGKLNKFLMVKLPSAWLCGVRVKKINKHSCEVGVKHRWINQNPFNSMYFAVQAMAAELSTGALVMSQIKESGEKISMLVAQNKASFTKKATGRIRFICEDGDRITKAIENTTVSGEGETFWMKSTGYNEEGVEVSVFEFEWTIRKKVRSEKKTSG
ncbi:DUF4442 domain-containing protein [Antarcticibacterium flavum]|uniref:DUF4442 domain-containing protein n=1 Tax=Antarcticibacterium flavum TaxID=2058175 RepID=A0A5B7X950_9FLAO|nr:MULTISPECIES: DUF4442 domain-containing protein [Antarcticibacterium]MCM4160669.1 thioesterase [Antarcticibacterium sp. W02-3]QCY71183.1 DUF4442 domain-containing protein [Antarcticibacterium flavum]